MVLSIQLPEIPEELLHRLDERARRAGVDRGTYVRQLIERDLLPPDSRMPFRDILAPLHAASQGTSEGELERLVTEELNAARRERRDSPHRPRSAETRPR
jgi:hypothetical protein